MFQRLNSDIDEKRQFTSTQVSKTLDKPIRLFLFANDNKAKNGFLHIIRH